MTVAINAKLIEDFFSSHEVFLTEKKDFFQVFFNMFFKKVLWFLIESLSKAESIDPPSEERLWKTN